VHSSPATRDPSKRLTKIIRVCHYDTYVGAAAAVRPSVCGVRTVARLRRREEGVCVCVVYLWSFSYSRHDEQNASVIPDKNSKNSTAILGRTKRSESQRSQNRPCDSKSERSRLKRGNRVVIGTRTAISICLQHRFGSEHTRRSRRCARKSGSDYSEQMLPTMRTKEIPCCGVKQKKRSNVSGVGHFLGWVAFCIKTVKMKITALCEVNELTNGKFQSATH